MNMGETLIVIGYVAGVILVCVLIVVLTSLSRKHFNKVAVLPEKYRSYTGRAEGRILKHHWERVGGSSVRFGSTMKEDNMDDTESFFIVTYEFEADGKTYKGEGEGSPVFKVRKSQTICYDPSDPTKNCTIYYLNSQKYNPNAIRIRLIIARIIVIALVIWYIASKLF